MDIQATLIMKSLIVYKIELEARDENKKISQEKSTIAAHVAIIANNIQGRLPFCFLILLIISSKSKKTLKLNANKVTINKQ